MIATPARPTESQEYHIPAPELRGAILKLGSCHDIEVGIDGPAGTGKTFGILYYIHVLLLEYPGAKWLITRRYNVDIAGSVMATYQQEVLNSAEGITYFGGNRVKPPGFNYPNGSFLAISGLDRPSRLKSFECDGVYINEATDCEPTHLEYARTRLRKGVIPWQQIIMDFNPDAPHHWLNQRMIKGITTRLLSRHEDNPRYYDMHKKDWTEEGRRYVLDILGGLTGVRYLRLRLGLWVGVEGMVYEEWNPAYHIVSREQLKQWQWLYTDGTLNRQVIKHIIAGVDWGWTNPGVLSVYGIDHDNRLLLLREVYRTRKTIDWWIAQGQALEQEFKIEKWVADPSRPDYIQQFNEAGLPCEGANNSIALGIGFLRKRLADTTSDRPRFMVYEYAQVERDEALVEAHKPTGITSEIEEYVWAQPKDGRPLKEEPVDESNHALDTARYVVMELDAGNDIGELDQETAQAISRFRGL